PERLHPAARVDELVEAHRLAVAEAPDVRARDVERKPGLLADRGVAADHDHVVAHADHLLGVGPEVVPPALAERVEDRRAHCRHAVVNASVGQALRLVPGDVLVDHHQRRVEVVLVERLVRGADDVEIAHDSTAASTSSGWPPISPTSHTRCTTPAASTRDVTPRAKDPVS